MSFKLPELPFAHDALEPHIDARTMEIHHGKHHAGYTNKLTNAIEGTDLEDIKKKTQSLIQVSMKLGEAVYKSQQKPNAKAQGKDDNKPNDKDNVVDADFEDVKEKKEEDKEKSA